MAQILLYDLPARKLHDHVVEQVGKIRVEKNRSNQPVIPLPLQKKRRIKCSRAV